MRLTSQLTQNAHRLLRIALAIVFLLHGLLKVGNFEGFASMLPVSYTQTVLVALAEAGGAIFVLIGGFGTGRILILRPALGHWRKPR